MTRLHHSPQEQRNCAGAAMTYFEVSLAIAKTLWDFDFERPMENRKADRVGEGAEDDSTGINRYVRELKGLCI
jgi:hypothetical protein